MKSATAARKLSIIVLFLAAGGYAGAAVQARVQYPQSEVLCLDRTIMVGSPLELVVASDANSLWSGGLFIAGDDRARGTVWGRSTDPNTGDFDASCLPAAGRYSRVQEWRDSYMWGFDAYASDDLSRDAGDWFVFDYTADDLGDCTVGFYEHRLGWNVSDPNRSIGFTHVPTRDFDGDGVVGVSDFARLAKVWGTHTYGGAEAARYDYDGDGDIDLQDLAAFSTFWLWGTPGWPVDVLHTVVDETGRSEITVPVGTTLTLYVDITNVKGGAQVFSVEVAVSDPNLGVLDNRPYDSNHPELSTARIVGLPSHEHDTAEPWPYDADNILFWAACYDAPFQEGHVAKFEYTALKAGDVRIELKSTATWHRAAVQPMILHQVPDPNQAQSRLDAPVDVGELDSGRLDRRRFACGTVIANAAWTYRFREMLS